MAPKEIVGAGRPGLATTNQVRAWREQLVSERKQAASLVEEQIKVLGSKLYEPSNYFLYYKSSSPNSGSYHPEPLKFTIDKMADCTAYDPRAKKDRWAVHHRLYSQGMQTSHNICSSQTIGSHSIIPGTILKDDPRTDGNGRSAALRGTLFYPGHLHV